jgi:hypothetical protein
MQIQRQLEAAMLFLLDLFITGTVTAVIVAYAIFLARIEERELKPKAEAMRAEALRHAS